MGPSGEPTWSNLPTNAPAIPNDEVERRELLMPQTEAPLSTSSTSLIPYQRCPPCDRSNRWLAVIQEHTIEDPRIESYASCGNRNRIAPIRLNTSVGMSLVRLRLAHLPRMS